MMEEFKRRKNLKDWHSLMSEAQRKEAINNKDPENLPMDGKSTAS